LVLERASTGLADMDLVLVLRAFFSVPLWAEMIGYHPLIEFDSVLLLKKITPSTVCPFSVLEESSPYQQPYLNRDPSLN